MNGPQHYREAEDLLAQARAEMGTLFIDAANNTNVVVGQVSLAPIEAVLRAAQVHATLANAAAVVATRSYGPQESWGRHYIEVSGEWQEVTGQ